MVYMEIKVHITRIHELMDALRRDEGLYGMTKPYSLQVLSMGSDWEDQGYLRVSLSKREVKLLQREDVSQMFESPLDIGG